MVERKVLHQAVLLKHVAAEHTQGIIARELCQSQCVHLPAVKCRSEQRLCQDQHLWAQLGVFAGLRPGRLARFPCGLLSPDTEIKGALRQEPSTERLVLRLLILRPLIGRIGRGCRLLHRQCLEHTAVLDDRSGLRRQHLEEMPVVTGEMEVLLSGRGSRHQDTSIRFVDQLGNSYDPASGGPDRRAKNVAGLKPGLAVDGCVEARIPVCIRSNQWHSRGSN
mmetsp:Transcript_82194/g.228045  ORF Transcript_82194/g.228045 Transcript_82194/m.228045 type:complete len:222 (+) Transcript_82194:1389-2054(+)